MPLYLYKCPLGCQEERVLTLYQHAQSQQCDVHGCLLDQIITAPILVVAQPECRYDSPIDGSIITTHAQRQEDLKRHGCIPYDPGLKTDQERKLKAQDEALDRSIEAHVEQVIEKMPTKARGKLYSEVTEQGMQADLVRKTM